MTADNTELSPAVTDLILAFADDEHLMGQQYTEWIGVTPFLEEDLAFSSIGQDELGHAAALFSVIVGDDDQAIDELAFHRDPSDFRSCWFVENLSTDWADALVRHWLYDQAERLRWQSLTGSSITALADVTARAVREEAFHLRHADGLLDVLLVDEQSRAELLRAVADLAPVAVGLFDPVAGEAEALAAGVINRGLADMLGEWQALAEERFGSIQWGSPPDQRGRTVRSDDFGPLMARMREVFEVDAGAVW